MQRADFSFHRDIPRNGPLYDRNFADEATSDELLEPLPARPRGKDRNEGKKKEKQMKIPIVILRVLPISVDFVSPSESPLL